MKSERPMSREERRLQRYYLLNGLAFAGILLAALLTEGIVEWLF